MAITTPPGDGGQVEGLDDIQIRMDAQFLDTPLDIPIVEMDKIEGTGRPETHTDQTGHTESKPRSNLPLTMTVQGEGHLEHARAVADFWRTGAMVEVTSLIGSGGFFVTDFTLKEVSDQNKLEYDGVTARRIGFQMQLKTPSAAKKDGT